MTAPDEIVPLMFVYSRLGVPICLCRYFSLISYLRHIFLSLYTYIHLFDSFTFLFIRLCVQDTFLYIFLPILPSYFVHLCLSFFFSISLLSWSASKRFPILISHNECEEQLFRHLTLWKARPDRLWQLCLGRVVHPPSLGLQRTWSIVIPCIQWKIQ